MRGFLIEFFEMLSRDAAWVRLSVSKTDERWVRILLPVPCHVPKAGSASHKGAMRFESARDTKPESSGEARSLINSVVDGR